MELQWRFLACVLASTLLVGFVAPGIAVGQTSADPKARRDELSGAIEDASANEIAAVQALQQVTAQRQDLEAKVATLDGQIADATQKVEVAEAEIARLQAQVETVQGEIDWIHAEIEKLQAQLNESTVALYKGSGNGGGSALRLLSTASGAHELVAGSKYLGENSRRVERELQRQGTLKAQLDEAERDLKNQKAKAQEAERVAADERDRVRQLRAAADADRNHAISAVAQEQQIIEGIRARRAEFEAEYNAVQAQIQAQIAASVSKGNPTPPTPDGAPELAPVAAPSGVDDEERPVHLASQRLGWEWVRTPDPPDLGRLPDAHRRRHRRAFGHADQGGRRRHRRHGRPERRLRQLDLDRSRGRTRNRLRASVLDRGVQGTASEYGRGHRARRVDRCIDRTAPPLGSARQWQPRRPHALGLSLDAQ